MAHQAVVPTYPLEISKIRKEQRRIAALLQRSDVNIYVPRPQRSEFPKGYTSNTARSNDPQKHRRSLHMILPGLMRERSRSLSNIYDDPDTSNETRNRKRHPVQLPRLDPLSDEARLRRESIRAKDIVRFSYESLNEKDLAELPAILRKPGVPPVDRDTSYAMFVPSNTPLPLRSKVMQDVGNTRSDMQSKGTREKDQYVNRIGNGNRDKHKNGSYHRTGQENGQQCCTCHSPAPVNEEAFNNRRYHGSPGSSTGRTYVCSKCGRPLSDSQINQMGLRNNRSNKKNGHDGRYDLGSRNGSGYPRGGYSREQTGYSSMYQRMNTCSSFSEMDPTVVEDAWMDKVSASGTRGGAMPMVVTSFSRNNTGVLHDNVSSQGKEMDGRVGISSGTTRSKRLRFAGHSEASNKMYDSDADTQVISGELDINTTTELKKVSGSQNVLNGEVTATHVPDPVDISKIPSEAYRRAIAMAQKDKLPDDPAWYFDRITKPFVFSYFDHLKPKCQCGDKHKSKDQKPSRDSKGTESKGKKSSKKKSKKNSEMKNIFGSVSVYDFYPGGKFNMR